MFLSSSFHRRTPLFPYGNQANKKIRDANQLVINFLVLLAVAESRNLFWMWLGAPFGKSFWFLLIRCQLMAMIEIHPEVFNGALNWELTQA